MISPVARQYLRLHLAANVGPIRVQKLLEAFGSIDRILGCGARQLAKVEGIGVKTAEVIARALETVESDTEIGLAQRSGVRIVCIADPDYPPVLKYLPDPPIVLYIRGRYEPEDGVAVAIVGSRRCSTYGREQAQRFGNRLAQTGLTVVSGLAYGIDSHAHRGALAGGGRTVAILGCGLSEVYPPEHADLAEQIVRHGALISEFPMTMGPRAGHFPTRNRIIAGLSLGVVVVEAANNSGALITARLANEYNREVFAIPGRVDYPNACGVNRLIRDGQAKLVMEPRDVLDELGETGEALAGRLPTREPDAGSDDSGKQGPAAKPSVTPPEKRLIDALGREPVTPDELADRVAQPIGQVLSLLTTLQLKGAVRQLPGMLFCRR